MDSKKTGGGSVIFQSLKPLNATVLIGLSLNLEITLEGKLPEDAQEHVARYGKNLVKAVDHIPATPGTPAIFRVTTLDGNEFTIPCDGQSEMAAGSSVNVAFVLRALGISDVGIIGAVGEGSGASSLIPALEPTISSMLLYKSEGTSRTITVRDPSGGGSTLLCAKKPYHLGPKVLDQLAGATPNVLVLTGVKPMDMVAARSLYKSSAKVRAIMPHASLLRDDAGCVVFKKELLPKTDLLQLNAEEAQLLLGDQTPFEPESIRRISELGPQMVIVTMGANGAVLMEKDGEPEIVKAFPSDKVVDTSGIGDTHFATFINYRWLRQPQLSLVHCLTMAGWIASRKVAQIGPWAGIPSKEDREVMIANILAKEK
ncbi:MAG: PfkB family carbohydrate kinase [Patescibacteria group bacterium]